MLVKPQQLQTPPTGPTAALIQLTSTLYNVPTKETLTEVVVLYLTHTPCSITGDIILRSTRASTFWIIVNLRPKNYESVDVTGPITLPTLAQCGHADNIFSHFLPIYEYLH